MRALVIHRANAFPITTVLRDARASRLREMTPMPMASSPRS